jgi:photosystem II stability/assembly factor-like uncharacterized protein
MFRLPTVLGVSLVGLMVLGQSCSISIGDSAPSQGGVYRSDDAGESWKQKAFVRREKNKTVSIAGLSTETLVISEATTDNLYLGTRESGIWRSTNAGDRWESTSLRSGRFRCISIDPSDEETLFTSSGGTIYKSEDAGKTWKGMYQESQPGHTIPCVIVDPLDVSLIWAVSSGGKVLQSRDAGETWTLVQTTKKMTLLALAIDQNDGRLIMFGTRGIFAVLSDGSAWEDLSPALKIEDAKGTTNIQTVTVTAAGEWYLGTKFGPIVSSDGGATWEAIPTVNVPGSTAVTTIAVNPVESSELYLVTGNRLHHTLDAGTTWSVKKTPTSLPVTELQFDPLDETRLYFGIVIPLKK